MKFAYNLVTLGTFHDAACFIDNPFPKAVNGSLWTIRWEFLCYLGVPAAWRLGVLGRWQILVAATVLLMIYGQFQDDTVTNLFIQFMVGALFHLFEDRIPWRGSRSLLVVAMCVMGLVVTARYGGFKPVFPLLGGYLLFWFAFNPRISLQNFTAYGDFSYGTYLYAFPIQQLMVKYGPPLTPPQHALIAAFLSVAVGAASWYLVERRFLIARAKPASASN
jgi:peptidoglycan/LPS O-acetylase OafA/YrhL